MQIHPPPESLDSESAVSERPPVDVTAATDAVRAVTLVRVELHSDVDAPLRVRLRNRLDGPVLPPRTEGVPADGWDDGEFTGTLPANGSLGVGYACPRVVEESEAPVAVELLGPSDGGNEEDTGHVAAAVRDLGRSVPPADAVPTGSVESVDLTGHPGDGPRDDADPDLPDSVAAWLDAVEARVERAERLTDASAAEAASVLEDCGDPDAVAAVPDRLGADTTALRGALERVERLLSRAAAANPEPVATALAEGAAGLSESQLATEAGR
ncbi:DUF7857 domain-containing protein [Halobellus rubicundus]|uniref:DUF8080 domain-containing protein n=1 Tax=Halobellus rubicundus TaxID=2996466 RepID=A0ABD5M6K6_9EURY